MAEYNSLADIFAAGTTNMEVLIDNGGYDDNTYTALGADWLKFGGVIANNIYINGNSWFGLGSNLEQFVFNRRDTKMNYLYREEGILWNYYKFIKFRWSGVSAYSQTASKYQMTYDLVLWENGYITLYVSKFPTTNYDGTFWINTGTSISYTKPTSAVPYVTFIPQDEDRRTYAIQYDLVEFPAPFDKKYLIKADNILYNIVDNALNQLEITEISVDNFLQYGSDIMPTKEMLFTLTDPEVLYWQDSMEYKPRFTASVKGIPPIPQVITTSIQDMSDETILGIEGVQAVCSDDILFAISFDNELTWKAYDGTAWINLDLPHTGMSRQTMENISLEAWAEIVTSNQYKIRFVIPTIDSYLTSLVVDYIN